MGALTLQNNHYKAVILRGWSVKSYDSIDPTDAFGKETKVYLNYIEDSFVNQKMEECKNKNQIVKIEPHFSNVDPTMWLTDKGRQFFDSISGNFSKNDSWNRKDLSQGYNQSYLPTRSIQEWNVIFKAINKNFYIFDICNFKFSKKFFFIILFENLSIEIISLLQILTQISTLIKIRKVESHSLTNDLEYKFQLNLSQSKLLSSTLCILFSANTRYEGSNLNLKLRQRFLKGNFKILSIGPFFNLTFPTFNLGSHLKTLTTIIEGNHFLCQDLITENNPILISNSEIFKRNDIKPLMHNLKNLAHTRVINKAWNGFNIFTSTLSENGSNSLAEFQYLSVKDFSNFSSLYILNTSINSLSNIKKIIESQLFYYSLKNENNLKNIIYDSLILDTNYRYNSNFITTFLKIKKFVYLPNGSLFESNETFLNTEGLLKRTTKLIFQNSSKNNWQLIRKLLQHKRLILSTSNLKDNKLISFNVRNIANFKNFISFHYLATQNLTKLNFYLNKINKPYVIINKMDLYKSFQIKLQNTAAKYWLDDFFTGGKDQFCQNSLVLIKCSINTRTFTTNFF